MYAVTVSIGRNVTTVRHNLDGTEINEQYPMTQARWDDFRRETMARLIDVIGVAYVVATERHEGVGSWGGVIEESCKLTVLTEETPNAESIAWWLRMLASDFQQEAVALTVAESVLVEPSLDTRPHFYPTGHPHIEGVTA